MNYVERWWTSWFKDEGVSERDGGSWERDVGRRDIEGGRLVTSK